MKLKKYMYALVAVAGSFVMASCSDREGTEPGTDGQPAVTVYTYAPGSGYNSDEDVMVRVAVNNQVAEVYYLYDTKANVENSLATSGETAYADYVVANGTKVAVDGNPEFVLTGLLGEHLISVVGVSAGGAKSAVELASFTGLTWSPVVTGTVTFGFLGTLGLPPHAAELQICDFDSSLYRIKDMYGTGSHLKFSVLTTGTEDDAGNVMKYCRISSQDTGLSVTPYGAVGVQDVGYWQNDDSFVTGGGYENYFYVSGPQQYTCSFMLEYYVSVGALDYSNIDTFVPDAQ